MNMKSILLPFLALALVARGAEVPSSARETNLAFIAAATARDQAAASNRADRLARRGLFADKQAGAIRLWAEATGIHGKETEFFLISEASGHDYEALAVAFCTPGDVRDALLFLGMKPGRPVDYGACRFWPKGERVLMTFRWTPPSIAGEPVAPVEAAAESLIYDKAAKAPLPAEGFVFTGSRFIPHPQETNRQVLAADLFDPHSIASAYNEPQTILDMPHQAPKNLAYGWRFPSAEHRFAPGQLIEVTLRPERLQGPPRVLDLTLQAAPGASNGPPRFTLSGLPDQPALVTSDVGALAAAFQSCTNRHRDPFVTWLPDPTLPLEQVRLVCAFLDLAEGQAGARLEPPPEGRLFFRAFLPDEKFRDPKAWIVKPYELHLAETPGGATGTVTMVSEKWTGQNEEPDLLITRKAVATPEALRAALADRPRETPVMLIHAPGSLPYAALSAYATAALPTHSTIWVFLTTP